MINFQNGQPNFVILASQGEPFGPSVKHMYLIARCQGVLGEEGAVEEVCSNVGV